MNSKDKAKELVDKMYNLQLSIEWNTSKENKEKAAIFNDELGADVELYWHELAKQCALITINEMLDFRNSLYINEGSLAHQYLIEVKHEIEKL